MTDAQRTEVFAELTSAALGVKTPIPYPMNNQLAEHHRGTPNTYGHVLFRLYRDDYGYASQPDANSIAIHRTEYEARDRSSLRRFSFPTIDAALDDWAAITGRQFAAVPEATAFWETEADPSEPAWWVYAEGRGMVPLSDRWRDLPRDADRRVVRWAARDTMAAYGVIAMTLKVDGE